MDWDDLKYFLAVAEAGSLQGAARRLLVNHSTVFRRINKFEQAVGVRLFDRLADGYQLTVAGDELFAGARRVGDEIDLLQLKVAGKDYRPSGVVRLTAPENLAYDYLPAYLATFAQRYPDIRLELSVGAQSLNLSKREADLALRATTAPPPHLIGRKVLSVAWAYYASEAYLHRRGLPAGPQDLAAHRLLGADGELARLAPLQQLARQFPDALVMHCSTLNAMAAMAQADYGIALLPDDQISTGLTRLFKAQPRAQSQLWLLTHPELRRTQRVRLLMTHLYESLRADPRLRQR